MPLLFRALAMPCSELIPPALSSAITGSSSAALVLDCATRKAVPLAAPKALPLSPASSVSIAPRSSCVDVVEQLGPDGSAVRHPQLSSVCSVACREHCLPVAEGRQICR